jgi:hypothetical protein
MEAKERAGTAANNTVGWTEEEVRVWEETCAEFEHIKSSDRAWLRFLGGEY